MLTLDQENTRIIYLCAVFFVIFRIIIVIVIIIINTIIIRNIVIISNIVIIKNIIIIYLSTTSTVGTDTAPPVLTVVPSNLLYRGIGALIPAKFAKDFSLSLSLSLSLFFLVPIVIELYYIDKLNEIIDSK